MPVDRICTTMIPAAFGLRLLTLMVEKGHDEDRLLANTGLTRAGLADSGQQIAGSQYAGMLGNARELEGDLGFAYELGMRSHVTKHGFIGFGLMSCASLREAISFGQRYLLPQFSIFDIRSSVQDRHLVIELIETAPLGALREVVLTIAVVEICNVYDRVLSGDAGTAGWWREVGFPCPEPAAYTHYRARLPKFHFNAPSLQIRVPLRLLDTPIPTADPISLKLISERCEQDLAKLMSPGTVSERVTRGLVCRDGRYPELSEVAASLLMSDRTLKRRLQEEGTSFNTLLEEVRLRESIRCLSNQTLAIKQVAEAIGYADPSNFARAFTKWTGVSPSVWRERLVESAK